MKKSLLHYLIILLLCMSQNFSSAAVVIVADSLTSSIIENNGSQHVSGDTSETLGSVIVQATQTDWDIAYPPVDDGFAVSFGSNSGGVSVVRGKGKPNGQISVAGTIVHSSVRFELSSGQTADYDFELEYLISSGTGGADLTSVQWSLINVTTGLNIFSGSDSTDSASVIASTGILSGSITEGVYELVIQAALNDNSMNPNSSASASFQNIAFNLQDPNSTVVVVPEPSGTILILMSMPLILKRRKR